MKIYSISAYSLPFEPVISKRQIIINFKRLWSGDSIASKRLPFRNKNEKTKLK